MLSRTARKGFTLVELIVVIVIIGILAVVAFATFSRTIGKAEESTAEQTALSVTRNASSLAAFDRSGIHDGTDWVGNHMAEAVAEVNGSTTANAPIVEFEVTDSEEIEIEINDGSEVYCVTLGMGQEVNSIPKDAVAVKGACT